MRRRRAGLEERAAREHADGDARLHIEDARTVQPPVDARERHPVELADGPDRVEMTEEQDLARPFVTRATSAVSRIDRVIELDAQMIAALDARQRRDTATDRVETRGELGAAAIDCPLVGGRRFEAHERFDRLEQPLALAATDILQVV